LFLAYLDLGELDTVFRGRWLWSTSRPALARFRREDYPGDPRVPLDTAIRDLVEQRTEVRPSGPVRLLTHLRYFGYGFNPVSFFYCFDRPARRVEAVVAYVTSTPWGERHAYVLPSPSASRTVLRARISKALHVSPFLPMDLEHEFAITLPGERLAVHIADRRGSERVFDATLVLRRRPITGRELARALVRYPLQTAQVTAGIYWQALRLHLRGAPYHPHPRYRPGPRDLEGGAGTLGVQQEVTS
jgi:DUF1365 family protein